MNLLKLTSFSKNWSDFKPILLMIFWSVITPWILIYKDDYKKTAQNNSKLHNHCCVLNYFDSLLVCRAINFCGFFRWTLKMEVFKTQKSSIFGITEPCMMLYPKNQLILANFSKVGHILSLSYCWICKSLWSI